MKNEILTQNLDELFEAVKKSKILSVNEIIERIKKASLRGMGGAGFPTYIKWNATNCSVASEKYVVANGHEGEPFTLKDKFLMENFPHQIIAGMLIAARVIDAKNLHIVVNGNYKKEIAGLKKAINDFDKQKLLDGNIIKISEATKNYIGGEESALLNELEDKRIEPRPKTPLVCNRGLNGAPTIVNNVETFAQVPYIVLNNAESYKKNAIKIITVAGDVKSPGVYKIKIGDSLNNVIKNAGGPSGKTKFAIVGGYSGSVFLPKDFKRGCSFDYSTSNIYLGAGTVIVYNQQTNILDVIKNLFKFYKNESCGQCTPCREGTMRIYEIILNANGKISKQDKSKIDELISALDNSSFCAFGPCVGMAAKGMFASFPKEILSAK